MPEARVWLRGNDLLVAPCEDGADVDRLRRDLLDVVPPHALVYDARQRAYRTLPAA